MDIHYLGHAGFIVEHRNVRLLMDPWFYPAFLQSWFPYPDNRSLLNRVVGESFDYLYVSHGHEDHCDERLLRQLPRSITVIVPRYRSHNLVRRFRALGFERIIALQHRQSCELAPGFTATCTWTRIIRKTAVCCSTSTASASSISSEDLAEYRERRRDEWSEFYAASETPLTAREIECHFARLQRRDKPSLHDLQKHIRLAARRRPVGRPSRPTRRVVRHRGRGAVRPGVHVVRVATGTPRHRRGTGRLGGGAPLASHHAAP
jgi:hypothetical protein